MQTKRRFFSTIHSITLLIGASLFVGISIEAQTVINDSQTATPPGGPGSAWDFTGQRLVIGSGDQASGDLTVPAGTEVLVEVLEMGEGAASASGYLEINGEDARMISVPGSPSFHIGLDGYGEMLVTNGGLFTSRSTWVGFNPGSEGKVTLSGADSRWDTPGGWHVRIGEEGHGTLDVLDGAVMENHASLFIGNGPAGADGVGIVNIEGGSVVAGTASSRLGFNAGNSGTLNVTGEGSTFSAGTFFHVGSGGDGTLIITDGGSVITGTVNPDNSSVTIGVDEGATGDVTVSGPGSLLDSGRWLYVGRWGTGTLLAEGGATVRNATDFRVGREAEGEGEVTATGEGTTVEVGSFVQIGADGKGVMHVLDGASVQVPDNVFSVGRFAGGEGILNVASGGAIDPAGTNLYAGWEGDGEINVTEGGEVSTPGHLYIGREATADGRTTVSGGESRIALGGGLRAGVDTSLEASGGAATLILADGGTLQAASDGWARSATSIQMDGGVLIVDEGRLNVLDNSSLTGEGTVFATLAVGPNATVQGSGAGLTVASLALGDVTDVTLGGIDILSSDGGVSLNNVEFAEVSGDPTIAIVLDAPADDLIVFDGDTDFSEAHVNISFHPFPPGTGATFQLFTYTGPGYPNYNFASVTTPAGWVLEDGLLHYTGEVPDDSAFEEWANAFGLSGADATPEANPAGDGYSNLSKFAFGADPTVSTTSLVQVFREGNSLVLRWNRSTDPGIEYAIENRADLVEANWSPVDGAEPEVMAEPDVSPPEGYERVEWAVEIDNEIDRGFFRVHAEIDGALLP